MSHQIKWTVLTDNRSCDSQFATEHGLSILLETGTHRILLDTGASDVFVRNAALLDVDLSRIDYVFISHGHSDHAGGLRYLLQCNHQAKVIVSPCAVSGEFYSKRGRLHSITSDWSLVPANRLLPIHQTCQVSGDIQVIARIPQQHPMPKSNQNLFIKQADGTFVNDDFRHELALYVDGLLFTGCAHSGLENILATCPWPVHTVVGGFHLLDGQETTAELTALTQRLNLHYPDVQFYTSHCTGDEVYALMKRLMGDHLHAFCAGFSTVVGQPPVRCSQS